MARYGWHRGRLERARSEPTTPSLESRANVLVVVENVVGIVRRLHVYQPVVARVAIRFPDPVGIFVPTKEVDVYALTEAVEGCEEPPRPGGVPIPEILAWPPHSIKGDRV